MKERPIIFSAPMVRAILEGRKTKTRQVVKDAWQMLPLHIPQYQTDALKKCPYGVPGDRLWVKETWSTDPCYDHHKPRDLKRDWRIYYANGNGNRFTEGFHRLRSSRFMPRWASRLLLEITDVRVERLWEITVDDARAEGMSGPPCVCERDNWGPIECNCDEAIERFAILWDSINKAHGYGWGSNPFVWVLTFKKIGEA